MEMGSSSNPAFLSASAEDVNGLSFGKKIYFEDMGGGGGGGKGKAVRRGKVAALAPARCQVEGCYADLSGVKAYYCKHKVCGMHSKAPVVTVGGLEKRFCQQCSRFHQLSEFDQGKRSCRRRLAGHNERRRKPPHGHPSLYGHPSSSFCEGQYRSVLMDFTCPRMPPSAKEEWPTVRTSGRVSTNLWHGRLGAPQGASAVQEVHTYVRSTNSVAEAPPGQCLAGVSDTSCALSLLSTQPWGNIGCRNQTISANNSLDDASMAQPIVSSYMNNPWSFKGHGVRNSSLEVQHDFGLASNGDNCRYSGELELALQGNMQCSDIGPSRANDYTGNGIHWSS